MFTCPQLKNKTQTYLSLCMILLQVLAPNELVLRTLFYVLMDSQGSEWLCFHMFLSLSCTIQTQCSPQAVISVKQCCLMSSLRNCSDSELIYLLLIRHKAKLCPHCARFLFWSCCSTLLHSMPQYAVLQHTLPYYALSFYLLFSLTLSAVLPLCSFCYCPPSQHSCILVYSWVEKESKREKEREREGERGSDLHQWGRDCV